MQQRLSIETTTATAEDAAQALELMPMPMLDHDERLQNEVDQVQARSIN